MQKHRALKISGYSILLHIFTTISSAYLLAYTWPYRNTKAIQFLMCFTLSLCVCSFFSLNVYISTSLEQKEIFSKLRYIGFVLMAPSALFVYSYIVDRWRWLHNRFVQILFFTPNIITILFAINIFDSDYLLYDFEPYKYNEVYSVKYKSGPMFYIYYTWTNIVFIMITCLLSHSIITDRSKRKYAIFLLVSFVTSFVIDFVGIIIFPHIRWLMVAVGTFVIIQFSLLYVARKNGLFGIIHSQKKYEALKAKIVFQQKLLSLLGHDLKGNIHQHSLISHELKNKLQGSDKELAELILNSSQLSKDLLNNILHWVKAQNLTHFSLNLESFTVKDLIENIVKQIKSGNLKKRISVSIDESKKFTEIYADKEMFTIAIKNILTNAFENSEDASLVNIFIKDEPFNTHFEIFNQDTMMNELEINAIMQNRLFENNGAEVINRFGLYLAKHFIELHNGKLNIRSEINKGTTISFSLKKI